MSKELFELMREREIATSNFLPTKKEIHISAKSMAKDILDSGNYNIKETYAKALRLKEAINVIEAELKSSLPDENFEEFGIKGIHRSGGAVANYTDDIVYSQIKKQLDSRKTLLDAALKTDETFYDSEGIEVPKVSKTERKSSLAISF